MDAEKKRHPAKRILITVLIVLLALILIGGIFAVVYMNSLLGNINRYTEPTDTLSSQEIEQIENETEEADVAFTGPVMDPTDVTWETEPPEIIKAEHIVNILLIGQDRREGQGRQRSDTMILCTINKNTKTLTMTSFLRDLYVQIPGYKDNRLNATYAFGGMNLLNKTLERNFGIQVDGNIEVDFTGFKKVIDLMGGVDISLTEAEAGYLNRLHDLALKKGTNHLDGSVALDYARIRKLDSDFGRTNRQRKVITALVEKATRMNLTQLNELLGTMLGLVTTDMTNDQLLGYVMELFPLLTDLKIDTQHIPAAGTYKSAKIQGKAVLVPDLEANRKILAGLLED